MTLGRKLAGYRKLAGFTQQQLGEHLNLSAQAISKWEKDLTEPDLATLRVLAELYKVTVDELLDPNSGFQDPAAEIEPEEPTAMAPIGFCKDCGVTVTEENVGQTEPVVLCKKCVGVREAQERRAAEEAKRKRMNENAARERELNAKRYYQKRHRSLAFWIAGLAAAVWLALMIFALTGGFDVATLCIGLAGTYVVFSFVFCLFYDTFVQEVVVDWFGKSISWPGLIFEFDFDGILWLIGMKLLFFVLGLIFGIVTGAFGITIGLICAPFSYPFVMHKVNECVRNGVEYEEV